MILPAKTLTLVISKKNVSLGKPVVEATEIVRSNQVEFG